MDGSPKQCGPGMWTRPDEFMPVLSGSVTSEPTRLVITPSLPNLVYKASLTSACLSIHLLPSRLLRPLGLGCCLCPHLFCSPSCHILSGLCNSFSQEVCLAPQPLPRPGWVALPVVPSPWGLCAPAPRGPGLLLPSVLCHVTDGRDRGCRANILP